MHLPDELELRGLGQTGEHDVQVDIVGDFLPQPFESKPEVPSLRKEVNGVTALKVPEVEELVVTRTPSFLCLSVETRVESFPGRPPIPPGVGLRPLFSTDGELRRPGGREEKEGVQATVGLVPRCHGFCVCRGCRRTLTPFEDGKKLRRVEVDSL